MLWHWRRSISVNEIAQSCPRGWREAMSITFPLNITLSSPIPRASLIPRFPFHLRSNLVLFYWDCAGDETWQTFLKAAVRNVNVTYNMVPIFTFPLAFSPRILLLYVPTYFLIKLTCFVQIQKLWMYSCRCQVSHHFNLHSLNHWRIYTIVEHW